MLRVIKPNKEMFSIPKFQVGLATALGDAIKIVERDFAASTKTWKHRVMFTTHRPRQEGGVYVARHFSTDEIWGYVNLGTKAHLIPKNPMPKGKFLVFQSGGPGSYKAKTTPRVLGSHQGGSSGPIVRAKQVHHPGTEARELHIESGMRRQRDLYNFCIRAIAESSWR